MRHIAEPFGRNTAPAVAVAALEASLVWGEKALLFVMPAGDRIRNVPAFVADAQAAAALAARGRLVAFGIAPAGPEKGFGWLELGDPIEGTAGFDVVNFIDKPPRKAAERYAADGRHLLNVGLFCFTVGAILDSFEKRRPAMLEAAQESWIAADRRELNGALVAGLDEDAFARVPEASLTYAVMDEPGRVAAIRARFDWAGIGRGMPAGEGPPGDRSGP